MHVRTKPVRIFEADHSALRLIAGIEGRAPADVVHAALAEYLQAHRTELMNVFARAQKAFEVGDVDDLAAMLSASVDRRADELVARFDPPQ
jgi:non-homologous end joining protein Ku